MDYKLHFKDANTNARTFSIVLTPNSTYGKTAKAIDTNGKKLGGVVSGSLSENMKQMHALANALDALLTQDCPLLVSARQQIEKPGSLHYTPGHIVRHFLESQGLSLSYPTTTKQGRNKVDTYTLEKTQDRITNETLVKILEELTQEAQEREAAPRRL